MSSVSTITTNSFDNRLGEPVIPLLLRLRNLGSETIEKVKELKKLMEKYNSSDRLSKALRKWEEEIVWPASDDEILTQEFKDKTIAKVRELFRVILINPIDGMPFEDPILIRGEVMEKRQLQAYIIAYQQTYAGPALSPYDNQPIEAEPHNLAKEVAAWAKSCCELMELDVSFPSQTSPVPFTPMHQIALIPANLDAQSAKDIVSSLQDVARNVKRLRALKNRENEINALRQEIAEKRKKQREEFIKMAEKTKQENEERVRKIKEENEEKELANQRTFGVLFDQIADGKQQIDGMARRQAFSDQRMVNQDAAYASLLQSFQILQNQVNQPPPPPPKDPKCIIM